MFSSRSVSFWIIIIFNYYITSDNITSAGIQCDNLLLPRQIFSRLPWCLLIKCFENLFSQKCIKILTFHHNSEQSISKYIGLPVFLTGNLLLRNIHSQSITSFSTFFSFSYFGICPRCYSISQLQCPNVSLFGFPGKPKRQKKCQSSGKENQSSSTLLFRL